MKSKTNTCGEIRARGLHSSGEGIRCACSLTFDSIRWAHVIATAAAAATATPAAEPTPAAASASSPAKAHLYFFV